VDYYVRGDRFSLFGGMGFIWSDNAPGVAFATGARGFTGGKKHRAFLELSVSMLGIETCTKDEEVVQARKRYGPGVQVGYQYTATRGFTFMASGGVGYALGLDPNNEDSPWTPMLVLAAGYTWR
jgi:hypothetical protein